MPTIILDDDYHVGAGEVVVTDGMPAFLLAASGLTFTNLGEVSVLYPDGDEAYFVGVVDAEWGVGGLAFVNGSDALFRAVLTDPQTNLFGFKGLGSFVNDGLVVLQSAATTQGFILDAGGTFTNNGTILIDGTATHGVSGGGEGAAFVNNGVMRLHASTSVGRGIIIDGPMSVVNTGYFEISSDTVWDILQTIGLDISATDSVLTHFANSGVFIADVAVTSLRSEYFSPPQGSREVIDNSGVMHGDIEVYRGEDEVLNSGYMRGKIDLGAGDDIYDGRYGEHDGVVLGGDGADVLLAGRGEDHLDGGLGADALSGGAGDDVLTGGRDADTLDGGEGFDTASYEDSTQRVLADLGAGFIRSSGQDTVIGIEAVIGSGHADEMTGSAADERFDGRAGDDILRGGAGADVLIGGSGADILSGGAGADSFVFHAAAGHDLVTDFSAGEGDTLVINGFTGWQSLVQQGADTRIVLSADQSILLTGVDASAVAGAVRFGTEAAPVEAILSQGLITVEVDFHIYEGEELRFESNRGFYISYTSHEQNSPSIYNEGTILIGGGGRVIAVHNDYSGSFYAQSSFVNTATGAVHVDAPFAREAYGFFGGSWSADVYNHGLIRVSAGGNATGVESWGSDSFTMVNTGAIEVASGGTAYGAFLYHGGQFHNSGSISVTGGGGSIGVFLASLDWSFVNSGQIVVQDDTPESLDSIGLYFDTILNDKVYFNTGLIAADYAIAQGLVFDHWFDLTQTLWNTGELRGRVFLDNSVDQIYNLGLITGEIALGGADDLYDGRLGRQLGGVFGESGDDRLLGGADDDDLYGGDGADLLFGGGGVDYLIGEGGADSFQTAVGAGADVVVDFRSSEGDRILVDGYAAWQSLTQSGADTLVRFSASDSLLLLNVQASSISAANFVFMAAPLQPAPAMPRLPDAPDTPGVGATENPYVHLFGAETADLLVGGDGRDTLHGGAGDDLLAGGKGADTLYGGLGADTFYYMLGDGQDYIVGFDWRNGDRVWVGGVAAAIVESSAGTAFIDLEDGGRITFSESGHAVAAAIRTPDQLGGAGADTLNGTGGDDWIQGMAGADILGGSTGADRLDGNEGDDRLAGGDGDDMLDGGAGADRLEGGAGIDTADYAFAAAAVSVDLTQTTAQSTGGAGSDTLAGIENLRGSRFGDTLSGDGGANRLEGSGGDDTLRGGGGADVLVGGAGRDLIAGGAGDDVIVVRPGGDHDVVEGFVAGGTEDRIDATGFDHYWLEQVGADLKVWFDAEHSLLLKGVALAAFTSADINLGRQTRWTGTEADETLAGGAGLDLIEGGGGDDVLDGGGGDDVLRGGDGSDNLFGGAGDDRLSGGEGFDFADYSAAAASVAVTLWVLSAQDTGGAGTDQIDGVEGLAGSAFGDRLAGDDGINRIDGHGGDDVLEGRRGQDTLAGGAGRDRFVFNVGDGRDAIMDFAVADDLLVVNGYYSYSLAQDGADLRVVFDDQNSIVLKNVQESQFTAANISVPRYLLKVGTEGGDWVEGQAGGDNLRGLGGNDRLLGMGGDDLLEGGAGDDHLVGGPGTDILDGGSGSDVADYSEAGTSVRVDLGAGLAASDGRSERLISVEGAIGAWDYANELIGDSQANRLTGGSKDDVLRGGDGDDHLVGGAGNDILTGGAGDDYLSGDGWYFDIADYSDATSAVYVSPDFGATKQDTRGAGWDTLWNIDGVRGSRFDDYLYGRTTGAVYLDGAEGDDTLVGGGGSDTLIGGAGSDQFIYKHGGHDVIEDFTFGGDGDRLTAEGVAGYYLEAVGDDLRLVFDDFQSITLKGLSLDDFEAANIDIPRYNLLVGSAEADRLVGGFERDFLRGGDGDDMLVGGEGDDHLQGEAGDDRLNGGGGDDILDGRQGVDTADYSDAGGGVNVDLSIGVVQDTGGSGQDRLFLVENLIGSAYADRLTGTSTSSNILWGGDGADVLTGSYGDSLYGEGGNDFLVGGVARLMDGGDGIDTYDMRTFGGWVNVDLSSTGGPDGNGIHFVSVENANGGAGDDIIAGTAGANLLRGFGGADLLRGGDGNDRLDGGEGLDTASFVDATDGIVVDLNLTTAQAVAGLGSDTLVSIENLIGSAYDDRLVGTDGDNVLQGGGGDDRLEAGDGVDTADYLNALAGVVVNLALAGPQDTRGAGLDTLLGFENLRGSAFDDVLTGDDGSNRILGGAGADRIGGGRGDDHLDLGVGADVLVFAAGDGVDTVAGFTAGTGGDRIEVSGYDSAVLSQEGANLRVSFGTADSVLLLNVSVANLTAANFNVPASVLLTGGAGGDTLTGSELIDRIEGLDGNDVLGGRGGDDWLYGGGGDDQLQGGLGADLIDGGAGVDRVSYRDIQAGVTVYLAIQGPQDTGGAGVDTLVGIEDLDGSFWSDVLIGDDGANRIAGMGGKDTIEGGKGDDTLYSSGDTTFVFNAGDGHDRIGGFVMGGAVDRIVVNGYSSWTGVQESGGYRIIFDDENSILLFEYRNFIFTADDINIPKETPVTIDGTAAADTLTGTEARDTINGLGGNDVLNGLGGDDNLYGGDGDDILQGGPGRDILWGGNGSDTASYADATAGVVASLDDWAEPGVDALDGIENLRGSAFDDVLTGNYLWNRLEGLAGDDLLWGGSSPDVLDGGAGVDTVSYAGVSFEAVSINLVTGGHGSDAHGDTFISIERFLLSQLSDSFIGASADDTVFGGDGSDALQGGDGDDVLVGERGNDRLVGGAGDDLLDGGEGVGDQADYRAAAAAVTVNLLAGTATGEGSDTLTGIENVQGSAFGDSLTGDAGANSLNGHNGADILSGGEGNDILVGGAGGDVLDGGAGLDYASWISASAGVGVNLATGVHTGHAAGDTFASIERFRLSAHADTFQGNALTNYAYGAEGNDVLRGGGGFDRLYGEDGADQLFGEADNDVLIGGVGSDQLNGGGGKDGASYETSAAAVSLNLASGVHGGDAAGDSFTDIEFFILSAHNDSFVGSAAGDEAQGGAGVDVLNGGGGADWLRGQDGDDQLYGDAGEDILEGGAGADLLNGGDGVDYASYLKAVVVDLAGGAHAGDASGDTFVSVERFRLSGYDDRFTGGAGDDWVAGYMGNDTLEGGDGADTLNGGGSSDILRGGAGADKLIGEAGNDTLTGGAGGDAFQFLAAGFGADVITDFGAGDYIRISGVAGVDDLGDLAIAQAGAHTVITFPDGSTITLQGVSAASIDAGDFSFG